MHRETAGRQLVYLPCASPAWPRAYRNTLSKYGCVYAFLVWCAVYSSVAYLIHVLFLAFCETWVLVVTGHGEFL